MGKNAAGQENGVGLFMLFVVGFAQGLAFIGLNQLIDIPHNINLASAAIAICSLMAMSLLGDTAVVMGGRQDKTNQLLEELLEEKKRENASRMRSRRSTRQKEQPE